MLYTANLSDVPRISTSNHRKRSSFRLCETLRDRFSDKDRPFTSSLGPSLSHLSYKTVDYAEGEMRSTFRKEMNFFIDKKIRVFKQKRQEEIIPDGSSLTMGVSGINPEQMETSIEFKSSPRNIKQMKICELLRRQKNLKEKVVAEPFLKNDTEKISRIINKRNEQEEQYKGLRSVLKKRCTSHKTRRIFVKADYEHVQINNEPWVVDWMENKRLEQKRYHRRLLSKHERRNATIDF